MKLVNTFNSILLQAFMLRLTHSFLQHLQIKNSIKFSTKWVKNLNMVSTTSKTTDVTTTDIPANINIADYDLPTNTNNPNLLRVRHSTAHVMAMAVQKLFPQTKTAIGPWTDNGFVFIYSLTIKLTQLFF